MTTYLILGAGQAGFSVASGLRKREDSAKILLIGDEIHPPYQRPPLSKKYLLGEINRDRLMLRQAEWYTENAVDVHQGQSVAMIHREQHTITCLDGTVYAYDRLALTTGSTPRTLSDQTADNMFTLRGIDDIEKLRQFFVAGKRLSIIGGGYIGLEAAAIASQIGMSVNVIEAAPRILARVAAAETATYFRALHEAHGVRILEGMAIKTMQYTDNIISAICLQSGEEIPCDVVLVAIGVEPNTWLAEQAGLIVDNGIVVDEFATTSDPHIFAAGDCANLCFRDQPLRLESVQNATDQGDIVAANMLGEGVIYQPKPWFWSDQYDVKLQIAGLNRGYDRVMTRTGKREGALSVWYYAGETLLAVDAMNDTLTYSIAKKVLDEGKNIPSDVVANPETNLKEFL